MIKSSVEADCTGQFSALFLDYLRQKPELKDFYGLFPSLGNVEEQIKRKVFPKENRLALAAALENQYQRIPDLEKTLGQISLLREDNTFTITTGHQLNLFTGPLYFIYKIVTVINLAGKLKKSYPTYNFVPVYWMASEDHDFDEISYFKLDGKKYQWQTSQTGAVGEFLLDDSFKNFFKEVSGFVPEFFREAYSGSKTLAEAVRKYVHHLFGEKGLLIVDGNDASLKKIFAPVIKDDLFSHQPFQLASAQTSRLEELGYKSQIFPREINLFYKDHGLRERIEKVGEMYHVVNTSLKFKAAEMEQLIQQHPERFSPNVVLRPVYQEMILPNLAYIGGPAEVVYWLQLMPIFDHFEIAFPWVMPRNFSLVLSRAIQQKIEKLGLSDAQLFQKVEDWKKDFLKEVSMLDLSLEAEHRVLEEVYNGLAEKAGSLDKSLETSFEAAKVRSRKILDQMAGKLRKSEERRHSETIHRRKALQDYLYPGGSPQERVENFMRFYLEDSSFIEQLYAHFDPLDFSFIILRQRGN